MMQLQEKVARQEARSTCKEVPETTEASEDGEIEDLFSPNS